MLLEGNKIWLYVPELNAVGVSTDYIYKKRSESQKFNRSTWKGRKAPGGVVIDYDSLPEVTKSKLASRAELVKMCKANSTEAQLEIYEEACYSLSELHQQNCFVSDYTFFLQRTLSKSKAEDLKDASGWLRLLNKYRSPKETRTINFNSKAELRAAVVNQLLENVKQYKSHLYGFKVTNVAVLQRKELEWAKQYEATLQEAMTHLPKIEAERQANEAALSTLLHENLGNNHRRILGRLHADESKRIMVPSGKIDFSEWNAQTLVRLFMNPGKANKFDFENIYRRYTLECKKESRDPEVKLSAIKGFLLSNEVKLYTTRERKGWAELDKLLPHVYGKRPDAALLKGGYDGFQVDFRSKIDGAQLMLTVVACFDYHSEAVTGYDIGMVEDGLMVRNMYRNHLNLMNGRSFIEIESDRFSGNLAAETRKIFDATCQYVTQPMPNDPEGKAPNPKARFVERLLQELNRLAQNVPGWKGTNITSVDPNRKPNPDYRAKNYVEGYAESVRQIIDLINIYNNDKYNRERSRIEVCMENIHPDVPQIPRENIALLMNQHTITTVRNSKIKIEVNRREYEYFLPDFDLNAFKMMKGFKVKVFYDETDMSNVDVFGENDQYIATLGKLVRVARDKHTLNSNPDELAALGRWANKRKEVIDRVSRKQLEMEASMYGLDISNLSIDEAMEVIEGARITKGEDLHITHEELYADALSTPLAVSQKNYYTERIIEGNGYTAPISKEEKKGADDQRRQHERERAKRKGII